MGESGQCMYIGVMKDKNCLTMTMGNGQGSERRTDGTDRMYGGWWPGKEMGDGCDLGCREPDRRLVGDNKQGKVSSWSLNGTEKRKENARNVGLVMWTDRILGPLWRV